MMKDSKEYGVSLLQRNSAKEILLEKMRGKLASTPPPKLALESRNRLVRRNSMVSWSIRGLIAVAFIGVNILLVDNKEAIIRKIGIESVPSVPEPGANLDRDEQALYWTYALYDIRKFREHFGVNGYYAIDANSARRNLESLLPGVSNRTLGIISKYGPVVAYKSVPAGEAGR